MKRNTKKQFIKIFKNEIYLFILLLILIVFKFSYEASLKISTFFINWTSHAYFELERILISAVATFILTHSLLLFSKLKSLKLMVLKLYSLLCRLYLTSTNQILCNAIECFVNIIYKGDFINVKEQSQILEEILLELFNISKGEGAAHLFIVSGDAHSGKTVLAKKVINDIFTKEKYAFLLEKYNRSIFYYDFSCLYNKSEEIMENYENNYYDNNFIIFDNLHKLNDDQIKKLLKKVIRKPNNAKCVLMLTRNINHIIEGELVSEIDEKRKNHIMITPRLSVLDFDKEYDPTNGFFEFAKKLNINQFLLNDNYIKFHLYYIYFVYKRNKNPLIKKIFDEINHSEYTHPVLQGFIFMCCSALFTGTVDKQIIKEWSGRKNVTLYLKNYIDMGILNGFYGLESWEYSMHEKTARSYIQFICKNKEGLDLCRNYFRFLSLKTENELKYRYSLPFQESNSKQLFDSVINKGHFQMLYEDILFVIDLFGINRENYTYEISILNDRIGRFSLTKENILRLYKKTKNKKYLILLLHSDHTMYYHEKFFDEYNAMKKSSDNYLMFSTNYWIFHIKMHQGIWDLKKYVKLCENLPDDLDIISNQSYETSHMLRRFYFDAFRIYYLQGKNNFILFKKLVKKTEKIKLYLKTKLYEFKIFEYKFIYAHYIQYELLYRYYALDESYVNKEEISFFGCNNINEMLEKAVEYYYKAYNYFYESKDKTYYYVLLRLCELNPSFVLYKISNTLDEESSIEEFTYKEYKEIIGIFDKFRDECGIRENMIEYAAYAETYKMKFVMICKLINSDIDINYDQIIDLCAENAIGYHIKYNKNHPNDYGILRIHLLKTINEYLVNQDYNIFCDQLKKLLNSCVDKGYNREIKLIKVIQAMKSNIGQKRLYDIIRFYPIVLQ